MTDFRFDGPADGPLLAFAHGAGAGMDHPSMDAIAAALGDRGIRVARFEFPYMVARRIAGSRRGPDRQPVLLQAWRAAIEEMGGGAKVVVGGKSMGGRMASMVADEMGARGVVVFGYPFHPPGKPEKLRTAHLEPLATPMLIAQGERDTFGRREEVEGYSLSDRIQLHWAPDGDHSLKPRKASGRTLERNLAEAAEAAAEFIRGL